MRGTRTNEAAFAAHRRRWRRRAYAAGARRLYGGRSAPRGGARVAMAVWVGAIETALFVHGALYTLAKRGLAV